MIYLNHAGTSWPKPPEVHAAVARALSATPAQAERSFEASRDEVCSFLGIHDPERFLFTPGCTAALSLALADLPWVEGDVVMTSAVEHHALMRPIERLRATRGITHVAAPYRPGEPVDLDFVRDTLRREPVRLIAATAASNVTGELLPVHELARLAHERDALFLLDAAQAVGVVPVDVAALGADILVFAGHKGPQGPQGIGGLWAAPHVTFESPRASCEIRPGSSGEPRCATFPGYCDVGSVNLSGAAGLAAGLGWIAARGIEHTGGHARRLARELADGLRERPECTLLGGETIERTAALSLKVDGIPLDRAETHFAEHGIHVRAGLHCAPAALEAIGEPGGTVRISFGPPNTAADVTAVLAAIDAAK